MLWFQHPKYQVVKLQPQGSYTLYDFGLVELTSPAVLGHTAKLICLPFGNQKFVGKKLTVSGWGLIHPFKRIALSTLMSVDITIFPTKDCTFYAPPVYVIDPKAHLCAGIAENRGTLNGDSGGNSYLVDRFFFIAQVL